MRLDNQKQGLTFEFSISIGGGSFSLSLSLTARCYQQQSHCCAYVTHTSCCCCCCECASCSCNELTGNEETSLCHGAVRCAMMMKLKRASAIRRYYATVVHVGYTHTRCTKRSSSLIEMGSTRCRRLNWNQKRTNEKRKREADKSGPMGDISKAELDLRRM